MIKQLQMGYKLLRYAHGVKTCVIWSIIIFIYGVLVEWYTMPDEVSGVHMGIYFIIMVAMWPLQLLASMNVPYVIASSPWKKKIQTSVAAVLSTVCFLFTYAVVAIIEGIKFRKNLITAEDLTFLVLWGGGFALMLMVYMACSTKYFVVSTIVFFVAMSGISAIASIRNFFEIPFLHISLHPALVIMLGILLVVLGGLLQYGISVLLYKAPVSKYSQMNSLRRKM